MLLSYLNAITKDANPATPGFDPQAMYLVVCCLVPPVLGALVAALLHAFEGLLDAHSDVG